MINPNLFLDVAYMRICFAVHPENLSLQDDGHGGKCIPIVLSGKVHLFARDVSVIDDLFIQKLRGTNLFSLVDGKHGFLAVGALELLEV